MWILSAICAVLISGWGGPGGGAGVTVAQGYCYEIYAEKANTNRSVACGVCEDRGGHLVRHHGITDWDLLFGNWSHLENRTFWVDVVQLDMEWVWGDGQLVSTSSGKSDISGLPMDPDYRDKYEDWHCALWTPLEPFLQPANCSLVTNIICQLPDASTACKSKELPDMTCRTMFKELPGKSITSGTTETTSGEVTSKDYCMEQCKQNQACWAGHWDNENKKCHLLNGNSSTQHPAVPTLKTNNDFFAFGKTCLYMQEMAPEDSEFVCNCAAVQLPETKKEKEEYLEKYDQKVKKELVVPTKTLSATIRKKESATDERPSSTSMGYLGVTLMVIVFGGLVLMDLTSLGAHCKMGASNVKKAILVDEEEAGVSEA